MTNDLRDSWLVQRLTKPRQSTIFGADNPFAFGGGLVNGGLSPEAMNLLRPLFGFDYMGAAEFEFGAVPKALNGLAKDAGSLVAPTFTVNLADVPKDWNDKSVTAPGGIATIYALCREGQRNEVVARIQSWTTEKYPHLKETLLLTSALRPVNEWDGDVIGWLELDNGFVFFTDRVAWEGTCALFGVGIPEQVPS